MHLRPQLIIMIFCLLLAACGQQIEADQPPTPVELATATPGGRTTIWIATPTLPQIADVQPNPQQPEPIDQQSLPAPQAAAPVEAGTLGCITNGEPSLPASAPPITGLVDIVLGYLAEGGPPSVLAATLSDWGAVDDTLGILTADRDFTGDGSVDVLILAQAPEAETDQPLPPGDLLIFGCEGGNLRLLHQAGYNPEISLPQLIAVEDLTADNLDDIIYSRQTCAGALCSESVVGISFDADSGSFTSLLSGSVRATNPEISIEEGDGGTPALTIRQNTVEVEGAGPLRQRTTVYTYDGDKLVLTRTIDPERPYRIHIIQDADDAATDGNFAEAISGYQRALDPTSPAQSWTLQNEDALLRAYALYRLTVAQAANGDFTAAQTSFDELSASFGDEGTPGNLYFQLGRAFWESYQPEQTVAEGCVAAQAFAISTPDLLTPLNSFGTSNPRYEVEEICPL